MNDNPQEEPARRADGGNGERPFTSVDQAAADIKARMEGQRPRAAGTTEHTADAVRQAAEKLRGEEPWLAGLIEHGADSLDDLAQTLRNNDLRTLLGKVEGFARSQPVLFTGAAMALGFALTRVVTAGVSTGTGETRHES